MAKEYDHLIVGAGLFGATVAQRLTERGKKCLVVEKRERVGGNIATETVDGIIVHRFGAHVFRTDDPTVWEYVNRFARFVEADRAPIAEHRGKLYGLPFNMHTFYALWGCKTPAEARAIIDAQREACGITDPQSLEEKALALFGEDIYRTFIKGYAEKLYGRDCRFLPASVADGLRLRLAFDNGFDCAYSGVPENGYTGMIESMLVGARVLTGVDYFSDRERFSGMARSTVYTGPIDRYFDLSLGELEYRSLELRTERIDEPLFQGSATVYYTDFDTPYTRITEHKLLGRASELPHTVITREFPKKCDKGDEPFFPVRDDKNRALYARYEELARKERGVFFGGRLAEYRFYDMPSAVAAAMRLADIMENDFSNYAKRD